MAGAHISNGRHDAGTGSLERDYQAIAGEYHQLRQMASRLLGRWHSRNSIHTTWLVHETVLKLLRAAARSTLVFSDRRAALLRLAADVMRQVVVDYVRTKNRAKTGGQFKRVDLDVEMLPDNTPDLDVLRLNEILDEFAMVHPSKAELVKLRFFMRLTMPECAQVLGISLATAERQWRFSKAWLADRFF